jgi:hypothetical protein
MDADHVVGRRTATAGAKAAVAGPEGHASVKHSSFSYRLS